MAHLRGRLDVVNPVANESYKLLLFASREHHTHAAFHEVATVSADRFHLSCPLFGVVDRIYVVLFSNRVDQGGLFYQSCLAWGVVELDSSGGVIISRLVDVKDQTQAVLRVESQSGMLVRASKRITSGEEDLVAASIAHVRGVYSGLVHDTNSYLCWVATPTGKVPVLPFIASASCILTPAAVDIERGEEFLAHLFALAAINTRMGSKPWQKCNDAERCEWLAEAVLLMPRAMIYQQDVVRVGGGTADRSADQWVRLLSFPEPNLAGFDCEDSAILTLEILHLLKRIPFESALLRGVQSFLADYTACFIFGSLKVDDAYSLHAYAALLDARFLDGDRSSKMRPSIVLEGTARIGGSWVLDHNATLKRESFHLHLKLLGQLRREAGYARILRSEASMAMANENGVYGPIHAVIAGEHGQARDAVHLLAHTAGSSHISVTPMQLFAYSSDVQFKTALAYNPQSGAAGYSSMCNDLPRSIIPFVAESKAARPSEAAGRFHVDIHYETYVKRKGEIDRAVENARGGMRVTKLAVRITDQLKVMQIWFQ